MDNAKQIWGILLAHGCTGAGAAGVIGNMEAESGLEPCRMQGDFTNGYTASKAYAEKVDSGKMSRNQFIYDTTGGGGWGLCQWTHWSRKADLYDYCRKLGASIGDLKAQVEFFCKECRERYTEVWRVITTTSDVQEASDAVLLKFERPADMYNKRTYRASRGQYYYTALKSADVEDTPLPSPSVPEEATNCTIELEILKKGSKGDMVESAQILLIGYGFKCGSYGHDGDFGSATEKAAKKYQEDRDLKADGIIGPATWKALLGIK